MIFTEDTNALKETAKLIEQRLEMLEETNQPCYKERKKTTTNVTNKNSCTTRGAKMKKTKTSIQQQREAKNPRLKRIIEQLRTRIKQTKENQMKAEARIITELCQPRSQQE